jgi:hypothetical protein
VEGSSPPSSFSRSLASVTFASVASRVVGHGSSKDRAPERSVVHLCQDQTSATGRPGAGHDLRALPLAPGPPPPRPDYPCDVPQKRRVEEEAVLLIPDLVATSPERDERGQLAHGLRVDGQERPVVVLDPPIPARPSIIGHPSASSVTR